MSNITWQVYHGDWENLEDVINSFSSYGEENAPGNPREVLTAPGVEILYAGYDCSSYDGSGILVFCRDGKLYEISGSHCSCNDMADSWAADPTPVSVEYFKKMRKNPAADDCIYYGCSKEATEAWNQMVEAL